jgi:hypothetical protein
VTRAHSATLTCAAMACMLAAPAGAQESHGDRPAKVIYTAELRPMNTSVTKLKTTGKARFTIAGDSLTISVDVKGAPADVIHWQHFHGFKDDRAASCATISADSNDDGIVDLIETEPASGTTMVPFIADPVSMQVAEGKYPKASSRGSYEYRATVSLAGLEAAFGEAFEGSKLDLDRRVVLIHGVGAAVTLPASVASLGPIPPQVTLPIACGRIERGR